MSRHRRFAWAKLALCFTGLLALSSQAADGPKRLQRIQAHQALRVCIWPDYYGISFRNPKTQLLSGIDIDNAHDLAKALGVKAEFVDSSFATLVDDISQDRCDIAMFAIGITPARQAKLHFTQPHLASDIYAITSKTNRRIQSWADIDKAGTVVVVAKGTLHEPIMQQRLQSAELRVVDTPAAREQEVQSGRADVFMTDYPFSRRMLGLTDWARLVAPPAPYHLTSYAWAVAQGDEPWRLRLDAFVTSIKRDGRLEAAARRYQLDAILVRD